MAKKEESKNTEATPVVSVLEQLQKNSARKGGSRIKNRKYAINKSPEGLEDIRLSPQAIICVGIIISQPEDEITEAQLFDALEDGVEQFGTTKQTPWKVFQYYRKPIMDAGFLKEVKVAEEPAPEAK